MATIPTPIEMATNLTPTETAIRDFLLQEVLYDKELRALGAEDSLVESELLDSIAIMQIVAFCEQVFEITVLDEDLVPDRFENVRAIAQLIERRLAETTD